MTFLGTSWLTGEVSGEYAEKRLNTRVFAHNSGRESVEEVRHVQMAGTVEAGEDHHHLHDVVLFVHRHRSGYAGPGDDYPTCREI